MVHDIRFLVGVDGGGTSCRAAIADRSGAVLGSAQSGSSNITSDLELATVNILDAVNGAAKAAGLNPDSLHHAAAFLGIAGANVSDVSQRLSAALPFAIHQVGGDAIIALQGALGDNDGAIAILGTGSAFMSRKGDKVRLIGGWGFHLGDFGGGARLGREALEMALMAHDSMIEHTLLTRSLMAEFADIPEDLVLFAKSASAADYGRFAPLIIEHLDNEDPVAQHLFKKAAQSVDEAFDALALDAHGQIALLGGLSKHYPHFLAQRHQKQLVAPKADAVAGAIALAGKLAGGTLNIGGGRA
jgi:glucosamine kinase